MAINVFISVTRPFLPDQEDALAKLEAVLERDGLRPNTINRNVFSHGQPLELILEVMKHCAGVMVVALRRHAVTEGSDKPGSPLETPWRDVDLATPWNHIEAAMAYTLGLPIILIKERNVREDGLLERSHGWRVIELDEIDATLKSEEFQMSYDSWRRAVGRNAMKRLVLPVTKPYRKRFARDLIVAD